MNLPSIDVMLSGSESGETYLLASAHPKKRAGRRKFRETRHPVYRGVRRRGASGKWVCELRNGKSRLWLGTYPAPEMAARAHDVAALALRGRSACLNFADSAWRLPLPASASDADIRAAAAAAAESFRPSRDEEEEGCSSVSGLEYEVAAVSDAESSSGGDDSRAEEEERPEERDNCSYYFDEEAAFHMPGLLVDMAEGLMVAPPPIVPGEAPNHWGGAGYLCDSDVSIWNYSSW